MQVNFPKGCKKIDFFAINRINDCVKLFEKMEERKKKSRKSF